MVATHIDVRLAAAMLMSLARVWAATRTKELNRRNVLTGMTVEPWTTVAHRNGREQAGYEAKPITNHDA
jgi:hypothetical protein